MARIFAVYWVVLSRISDRQLTGDGPHFVGIFFNAVCAGLDTNLLATAAYHLQTNRQNKQYNKPILSQHCHYNSEHQNNWDTFVQLQTNASRIQTPTTTKTTPSSLALTRVPPAASRQPPPSLVFSQTNKLVSSKELQNPLLDQVRLVQTKVKTAASRAQRQHKKRFGKQEKQIPTFAKKDLSYLDKNALSASTKADDT